MKKLIIITIACCTFLISCEVKNSNKLEQNQSVDSMVTFGTMGKEVQVLKIDEETELFSHEGRGTITHMWFGGDFKGYEDIRLKIYVDGETEPSIDVALYLAHGIGFGDDTAPWGHERFGKTGHPSGLYNTYKIPFGTNIKIAAQLAPGSDELQNFWWIIRGTENLPVTFSGVRLPDNARLKVYKLENYIAEPYEEFNLCDIEGEGLLYQMAMQAEGLRESNHWHDISYLEACVRAYPQDSDDPLYLSSGLEDYFLGTYYFNRGTYANKLAGLTHFDDSKNRFSAYRLHEEDPVFFQNGLRLTNRCGEVLQNGHKLHNPPRTKYTVYTWVYQW